MRSAVQGRVARDLNVPWHKVQIPQYSQWEEAAFKADSEESKLVNISEEERERAAGRTIERECFEEEVMVERCSLLGRLLSQGKEQ